MQTESSLLSPVQRLCESAREAFEQGCTVSKAAPWLVRALAAKAVHLGDARALYDVGDTIAAFTRNADVAALFHARAVEVARNFGG
ncbi:hypothetical protein [Xanthobacter versatilis]|uniref:hypothetical protein n=1 Tax=Xanthobacter autotrophicus (strain ATCC BAA-1158 / Py2) TaxID=78245 RepID=UPI00372631D7